MRKTSGLGLQKLHDKISNSTCNSLHASFLFDGTIATGNLFTPGIANDPPERISVYHYVQYSLTACALSHRLGSGPINAAEESRYVKGDES